MNRLEFFKELFPIVCSHSIIWLQKRDPQEPLLKRNF